ncbi:MAG: hypothetical protein IJT59_07145 [Desulfovibrionaceae bacterium]|nr:hypothetical protein [Desulfovibrionaceae bacterium]
MLECTNMKMDDSLELLVQRKIEATKSFKNRLINCLKSSIKCEDLSISAEDNVKYGMVNGIYTGMLSITFKEEIKFVVEVEMEALEEKAFILKIFDRDHTYRQFNFCSCHTGKSVIREIVNYLKMLVNFSVKFC